MNDQRQASPGAMDSTGAPTSGQSAQRPAYERIEEVGSGGIGTVYRGRQTRLDREVAIKEIREIFNVFAGIDRDDVVDRFQSIVETQASLNHPNIIQIIDIDTGVQFPYSVMELAPRGNLRRVIDGDERPDLNVVLQYFLQVLHALKTAHDADVIHGNLKPENVVLDTAGNALVTDFGLSDIIDSQAGSRNQVFVGVGSVAYMSPEQLKDPNLVSAKSDMYSLGIMFYEMLTGEVPGRRSPMPSEVFEDIPSVLDDIFDQMSRDDETERYEAVDEIIDELYQSEEVVQILDDRAAVLFLSDPSGDSRLEPFEPLESLDGEAIGEPVPQSSIGGRQVQGAAGGSQPAAQDAVQDEPGAGTTPEVEEAPVDDASVGGAEPLEAAADSTAEDQGFDGPEEPEVGTPEQPQVGTPEPPEESTDPEQAVAVEVSSQPESGDQSTEDIGPDSDAGMDAQSGDGASWSDELVSDEDLDFGDLGGDTSAGEVESEDEFDEQVAAEAGAESTEEDEVDDESEASDEGDAVLDKLDEYGEMFE